MLRVNSRKLLLKFGIGCGIFFGLAFFASLRAPSIVVATCHCTDFSTQCEHYQTVSCTQIAGDTYQGCSACPAGGYDSCTRCWSDVGGSEAQACACGGGSSTCDPTQFPPGACTGCGNSASCPQKDDPGCDNNRYPGCSYNPGLPPGQRCVGLWCQTNCFDMANRQTNCQGTRGCTWTPTQGPCKYGSACVGGVCQDTCNNWISCCNPPSGWLDAADCNRFAGWAGDSDNPNTAIDVHFYYDQTDASHFIGSTTANGWREHAVCVAVGGGANCTPCTDNPNTTPPITQAPQCYHGYSYSTPASLKDGRSHTIYAFGINIGPTCSNAQLAGVPKTINCVVPPTCSFTQAPTQTYTNTSTTYSAAAQGAGVNSTRIYRSSSPGSTTQWTQVASCSSTSCTGTTSFPSVGDYWAVCNAYTSAGTQCTGNPDCIPPKTCTNWGYCGTGSTVQVHVTTPGPWWQVGDADVTARGSLLSPIPGSCSLPVCTPTFEKNGEGGYPGIPSYVGSYDFSAASGNPGTVSTPQNWIVESDTSFKRIYDYTFFKRQLPTEVSSTWSEINTDQYNCNPAVGYCEVNGGSFNSGGTPARGYVWYHFDGATYGDLHFKGNLNLTGSRKVVLMVEGANLYINGKINIQSKGNGFFMAVVGKDANGQKGNIIIDPSVSSPSSPSIEGIFFAEGQFSTGAGTNWLYLRGSVAALGGFDLQRNLTDNSTQPAEYFEYAPEMMLVYPGVFKARTIKWKEVAP